MPLHLIYYCGLFVNKLPSFTRYSLNHSAVTKQWTILKMTSHWLYSGNVPIQQTSRVDKNPQSKSKLNNFHILKTTSFTVEGMIRHISEDTAHYIRLGAFKAGIYSVMCSIAATSMLRKRKGKYEIAYGVPPRSLVGTGIQSSSCENLELTLRIRVQSRETNILVTSMRSTKSACTATAHQLPQNFNRFCWQ